jgi:hypothetical protein
LVLGVRKDNPQGYRELGVCQQGLKRTALDGPPTTERLWIIGYNSTHRFGLVEREDGTIIRRSWYEDNEGISDLVESKLTEDNAFQQYWGHY